MYIMTVSINNTVQKEKGSNVYNECVNTKQNDTVQKGKGKGYRMLE